MKQQMGPVMIAMLAVYVPSLLGGLSLSRRVSPGRWWRELVWLPLVPLGWCLVRGWAGWFFALLVLILLFWFWVGRSGLGKPSSGRLEGG